VQLTRPMYSIIFYEVLAKYSMNMQSETKWCVTSIQENKKTKRKNYQIEEKKRNETKRKYIKDWRQVDQIDAWLFGPAAKDLANISTTTNVYESTCNL